ncbi:hypothetical protein K469DRAFT_549867, partial [Zopfia rhizophila CBS 207.26]
TQTDRMESILPYTVRPWEARLPAVIKLDKTKVIELANYSYGIRIATSSLNCKGMVGMGGAI